MAELAHSTAQYSSGSQADEECNGSIVMHVLKYLHELDWFPDKARSECSTASPSQADASLDGGSSQYHPEPILAEPSLRHSFCRGTPVEGPTCLPIPADTWQYGETPIKPHSTMQLECLGRGMPKPEKLVPAAPGKRPMLLWCTANTREQSSVQTLACDFRHERYLHFQTAMKFTRWLFQQHRGRLQPWSVLVVRWREAKPAMSALLAARSGETSLLRPDDRRPPLRPATGGEASGGSKAWGVRIAVSHMVVTLESPAQEARAWDWVHAMQKEMPEVGMSVAWGNALTKVLTAILNEQGFCRQVPHFTAREPRVQLQASAFVSDAT